MKSQDVYGAPEVFRSPGWTIRVYHPILTEEERAQRMKAIEKAAAAVLISQYKSSKSINNTGGSKA